MLLVYTRIQRATKTKYHYAISTVKVTLAKFKTSQSH